MRMKLENLMETELDLTVFRYLTMPKFLSVFSLQALWFSKLNKLNDRYEGAYPDQILVDIKEYLRKATGQTNLPDSRIDGGREMNCVSCWFLGSEESEKMWVEYVGTSEGVVIQSTVRKLIQNVYTMFEDTYIGKVRYVDFDKKDVDRSYRHHKAFYKDAKMYSHESELRIVTPCFKHPRCVKSNGQLYTIEECSGKNMNAFELPGLNIRIEFSRLIEKIILAPGASRKLEQDLRGLFAINNLMIPIERSKFQKL